MTEPQQDDLTADDELVQPSGNGPGPEDPPEEQQPPQDPDWMPEGTVSEEKA